MIIKELKIQSHLTVAEVELLTVKVRHFDKLLKVIPLVLSLPVESPFRCSRSR